MSLLWIMHELTYNPYNIGKVGPSVRQVDQFPNQSFNKIVYPQLHLQLIHQVCDSGQ